MANNYTELPYMGGALIVEKDSDGYLNATMGDIIKAINSNRTVIINGTYASIVIQYTPIPLEGEYYIIDANGNSYMSNSMDEFPGEPGDGGDGGDD